MDIISFDQIQELVSFKKLDHVRKMLLQKRTAREIITNALIVYKNTGVLRNDIPEHYKNIVNEIYNQ